MGHFVNSSVNKWDTHTGCMNQSPSVSSTASSPEDILWECFWWWIALIKTVIFCTVKSPLNQDLSCDHTSSLFYHGNTFLPALKLTEFAQTRNNATYGLQNIFLSFLRNKQICYQVVAAVADLADVNLSDPTSYSLMFLRCVLAWYVPKTFWMSL